MPYLHCQVKVPGRPSKFDGEGMRKYAADCKSNITGIFLEKRGSFHNIFLEIHIEGSSMNASDEANKQRFRNIIAEWKNTCIPAASAA